MKIGFHFQDLDLTLMAIGPEYTKVHFPRPVRLLNPPRFSRLGFLFLERTLPTNHSLRTAFHCHLSFYLLEATAGSSKECRGASGRYSQTIEILPLSTI